MIPKATVEHYKRVQRLQSIGILAARRAWQGLDLGDLSSWEAATPKLATALTVVQVSAASAGASYSAQTLAQQGLYVAPESFVDPAAFGGYASDGRSLEGLLYSAVPHTKNLIAGGMPSDVAKAHGGQFLEMITKTQVSDAGRSAAGVDIAARPGTGYVRMLNPPSCSRCSVLAGRFYRWNAGFQRHPSCFPAGVIVSGPELDAASRRWYEGELVTLTTASGENLSLTGNHPVLTRRGWVPANFIQEGDDVFRSTRTEGASALVIPDHNQVPSLIEDVWSSFSVRGLATMPTTAEDFHGDGQDGEVDVVYSDRTLRNWGQSTAFEHFGESILSIGLMNPFGLNSEGATQLVDVWNAAHTGGTVGGSSLPLSFSDTHGLVSIDTSRAHTASFYPGVIEALGYGSAGHFVLDGEGVFAGSRLVGGNNVGIREDSFAPRWDAPALPFNMETREGYASLGRDLAERITGQVEADCVVKLSRTAFAGHVYSPTSSEGWLSANNLIVSNCDCVHTASTKSAVNAAGDEGLIHDPYEYFQGLSEKDQDRIYTKAGAQAIRDGGDISQVVNARRGMKPGGLVTTEGTSRRGNYGRGKSPRMTPEGIYAQGKSREETLALLERNGYILPGGQNPVGVLRGQREGFGALGRGGTRAGASNAAMEARRAGVRDPLSRATMTASERRVSDAQANWDAVRDGRNPFTNARGAAVTPEVAARVERDFRKHILGY